MNKKKCTVCKYYNKNHFDQQLEGAEIYDYNGLRIPLLLCRKHSVDLFKVGQRRFLLDHYKILVGLVGFEDYRFLEVLHKNYRNNSDDIY